MAAALRDLGQTDLDIAQKGYTVSPHQFKGIEISSIAVLIFRWNQARKVASSSSRAAPAFTSRKTSAILPTGNLTSTASCTGWTISWASSRALSIRPGKPKSARPRSWSWPKPAGAKPSPRWKYWKPCGRTTAGSWPNCGWLKKIQHTKATGNRRAGACLKNRPLWPQISRHQNKKARNSLRYGADGAVQQTVVF